MKETIKLLSAVCLGAFLVWISTPITHIAIKEKMIEPKSGEKYVGWDMPCNYTRGADRDNQSYLDCANGIVYQQIGISPSVTYFNPDDEETNAKYCKHGQVATFAHDNPLTSEDEDHQFVECMNF